MRRRSSSSPLHTLLAGRPVPTTADWLTAWTTLGAFLAAGAAAVVAYRGLKATQRGHAGGLLPCSSAWSWAASTGARVVRTWPRPGRIAPYRFGLVFAVAGDSSLIRSSRVTLCGSASSSFSPMLTL